MDDKQPLVLIVEDDAEMRLFLRHLLQPRGFQTVEGVNGLEALALIARQQPDVILLDLMMPRMDGFESCREIRRQSFCPIIVISALHDEHQKVRALEAGADDYLTKPFGKAELLARIHAALRRAAYTAEENAPQNGVLRVGELEIDLAGNSVRRNGEFMRLTKTELNLVKVLAQHVGRVVDQRTLLQRVWGPEYGEESEYLHVYIGRLRRKLEIDPSNPRFFITEPGIGYRMALA